MLLEGHSVVPRLHAELVLEQIEGALARPTTRAFLRHAGCVLGDAQNLFADDIAIAGECRSAQSEREAPDLILEFTDLWVFGLPVRHPDLSDAPLTFLYPSLPPAQPND